jgi:hypothetical protein
LLRDATRRRLDSGQLVDVHLRAATLLQGRDGAPEDVAYHLLAAAAVARRYRCSKLRHDARPPWAPTAMANVGSSRR